MKRWIEKGKRIFEKMRRGERSCQRVSVKSVREGEERGRKGWREGFEMRDI